MLPLVLAAAMFSATPATLGATLAKAGCGDHVVLKPGDYGEVVLSNRSCSKPMLLDTRAATLALRVQNVEGLTIRGGVFDASASPNRRGVSIDRSSRVQLVGAKVDDAADAIMVVRSSDVTIRDAVTSRIVGNNLTIVGSQRVTVKGLVCRDAVPNGTIHPDCVQGWSLPDRMTTDVLITGVDMIGPTQGIFFGDDGYGYERITIFHNRIIGTDAPNGISIRQSCLGCVIANNRVSTLNGSKWQTTIYAPDETIERRFNLVDAYGTWPALRDKIGRGGGKLMGLSETLDERAYMTDLNAAAVPEPGTWAMMIGGVAGLGVRLRQRRRALRRLARPVETTA